MALSPTGPVSDDICDEQEKRIDEEIVSKPAANSYQVRIPNDLPDGVFDCLRRRYRLAGWSKVEVHRMYGEALLILER